MAVMVLALAGVMGTASACTSTPAATVSAVPAQAPAQIESIAEAASIVSVSHRPAESAGHQHDGPHQHNHGGTAGCCMLCCCVAAPHVLFQSSEIVLDRPLVRAFFVAAPAAVAKVVGGLPFRPPRTV